MRDRVNSRYLEIGERIRKTRKEKGWTQKYLAEKAEVTVQSVLYIEKGKRGMTSSTMHSIAGALDVTSDYLLSGTGQPYTVRDSQAAIKLAAFTEDELNEFILTVNKLSEMLTLYKETFFSHQE